MVEVRHAIEDEIEIASDDENNMICPHMDIVGVCLEPDACFMRHEL